MYQLNFDDKNRECFNVIYEALRDTQYQMPVAEMRTHNKVLDAFEAAGTRKESAHPARGTIVTYIYVAPCEVLLEDAWLKHLKLCFEQTPWLAIASRTIAQAWDMICEAQPLPTGPKRVD